MRRSNKSEGEKMRLLAKIALVTGVLALAVGPAALAAGKPEHTGKPETVPPTGKGNGPDYQPSEPGSKANPPEQAKAYGWRCRGESRKREKGDTEKGTPFSRCVHNLKQAHNHPNMAPGRVCKGESRKREKGDTEKGTPFSRCVHNVIKQRKQERQEAREQKEQEQSTDESSTTTSS
jgi:hypothetical protein